MKHKLLKSTA